MALSGLVACVCTHPPIFNRSKHATFAQPTCAHTDTAGARVLLPVPGKINRPVLQKVRAEKNQSKLLLKVPIP